MGLRDKCCYSLRCLTLSSELQWCEARGKAVCTLQRDRVTALFLQPPPRCPLVPLLLRHPKGSSSGFLPPKESGYLVQGSRSVPPSPRRLRIAISGGALAGATLMNALSKHPHLDPHIYESAAEFSERGAAVGLSVNAQRALSEIGEPVRKALDNAGAVEMHSSRQMLVRKSQHFDIMSY